MHIRGRAYWEWADPALRCRVHDEELENGATIDVQVRLSRTGAVQLFIGVYASTGEELYEEALNCRGNESMTRALTWGIVNRPGFSRHSPSSLCNAFQTLP
ncbi:hypothetical protein D9M71_274940 [compost metagenome]